MDFLGSNFFKNESLIRWAFLSSKLDSPVYVNKTLERHPLNVKKVSLQCFDYKIPTLGMNDGSLRTTFASGTGKYPNCLSEEMEIMSNTLDQVDQIVSDIIEVVVGNELKYQDEKTVYDLKNSPIKEHVHIYAKSNDFDGTGKGVSF